MYFVENLVSISVSKLKTFIESDKNEHALITGEGLKIRMDRQKDGYLTKLKVVIEKEKWDTREQIITLISKPSNLGKGYRWFFICPLNQKPVNKLFLTTNCLIGYTPKYHRYRQQNLSKNNSLIYGATVPELDKLNKELYYYKTKYYGGKKTRAYKRIEEKVKKAERKFNEWETKSLFRLTRLIRTL